MPGTLHIYRGLPASGKSTEARKWVAEDPDNRARLNRDDLRMSIFGKAWGLSREQEQQITSIQHDTAKRLLTAGLDVVTDDTNLNAKFAKEWLKVAQVVGADVEWHDEFLKVGLLECIERDAHRSPSVGADVIKGFYSRYLAGKGTVKRPELPADELPTTRRYDGTPGKPQAFLVDLDGTVALNGPDRDHPHRDYFAWHLVGGDLPNKNVIHAVQALEAHGLVPLYVSGRDGSCRGETDLWIVDNIYGGDNTVTVGLHMREAGDMRKDNIVKLEIFDREIRDNYDVVLCLDDRNQVVEAYRGIGLTVLQVADGNF